MSKREELNNLVWLAADELLANGEEPTIDKICQKLSLTPQEVRGILAQWKKIHINSHVNQIHKDVMETVALLANIAAKTDENTENTEKYELTKAEEKAIEEKETENEAVDEAEENDHIPDYVQEIAKKADKKAQYMAAGELMLTQELYRYYRKRQQFSDPEIQKQVEEAMAETAEDWAEDIENFSPSAMLKKFGK